MERSHRPCAFDGSGLDDYAYQSVTSRSQQKRKKIQQRSLKKRSMPKRRRASRRRILLQRSFELESAMRVSAHRHRKPPPCALARRGAQDPKKYCEARFIKDCTVLYRNEFCKVSFAPTTCAPRPRGSLEPTPLGSARETEQ